VGRWGGEEFLVLLPDTGAEGSRHLGQRVVDEIASEPFTLPDGSLLPVTVSVGCAVDVAIDPDALVATADAALYEAKTAGRNRVACAATGDAARAAQILG
jgi:two-component system, cell cycle response regulator